MYAPSIDPTVKFDAVLCRRVQTQTDLFPSRRNLRMQEHGLALVNNAQRQKRAETACARATKSSVCW